MSSAIELSIPETLSLTDEQFLEICRVNQDLRLEKTATGELIIMHPTGGETGKQNSGINAQLWLWNQQTQLGEVNCVETFHGTSPRETQHQLF